MNGVISSSEKLPFGAVGERPAQRRRVRSQIVASPTGTSGKGEREARGDGVVAGAGDVEVRSWNGSRDAPVELLQLIAGLESGVVYRVLRRGVGLHDRAEAHALAAVAEHRVHPAAAGGPVEDRIELDVEVPCLAGEVRAAGDHLRPAAGAIEDERLRVQTRELGRGWSVLQSARRQRRPPAPPLRRLLIVHGGVEDVDIPARESQRRRAGRRSLHG